MLRVASTLPLATILADAVHALPRFPLPAPADIGNNARMRRWVPLLVFAIASMVLIGVVAHSYLLPAFQTPPATDPKLRRYQAAVSLLLLSVVLVVIFGMGVLTLRVTRRLRHRDRTPPKPTRYVDAWAEAGKRAKPDDGPAE